MPFPVARCVVLLAFGSMPFAFAGCEFKSTVAMKVGARQVKGTLDKSASIANEGENVVVTSEGHKLRFEKDRVLLDDNEQMKLPLGSRLIEFEYINEKLSVTVDGNEILKEGKAQ